MRHLAWSLSQQGAVIALAVWLVVVGLMIHRVTGSVASALDDRRGLEASVARVLAEELAADAAADSSFGALALTRHGYAASASRATTGGPQRLELRVTAPSGRAFTFRCAMLAGGVPRAFHHVLSARGPRPDPGCARWDWLGATGVPDCEWLGDDDIPQLEKIELADARVLELAGIAPDPSIALTELPAGTDRRDHVVRLEGDGVWRPNAGPGRSVAIDGHLWIGAGRRDVVVELTDVLTIAVHGNVYVGGSLSVRGPGRLVLATVTGAHGVPYRDVDFDGRASRADVSLDGAHRGPIEGAGAIYLGFPGNRRDDTPRRVRIDAALFVSGELHLGGRAAVVTDVVALMHGLTMRSPGSRFAVEADHRVDWSRRRLPGFVPVGDPRPGRLVGG